jgi:hypothetical protein
MIPLEEGLLGVWLLLQVDQPEIRVWEDMRLDQEQEPEQEQGEDRHYKVEHHRVRPWNNIVKDSSIVVLRPLRPWHCTRWSTIPISMQVDPGSGMGLGLVGLGQDRVYKYERIPIFVLERMILGPITITMETESDDL